MVKTKITAHRGYSAVYPENTLLAFQKAIASKAERIELDVHASSDHQLIVHHDYYLGHTDNGNGIIYEKPLNYLQTLDAGSWLSPRFAGLRIPLLSEVFETCTDQVEYELELKGFSLEFLSYVLDLIKQYDLFDHVEFTSPHLILLLKLKQKYPDAKTGFFVQPFPDWMDVTLGNRILLSQLKLGDFTVAHCPLSLLDEQTVSKLHTAGFLVHGSDLNAETSLREVFKLSVDQISTNNPELASHLRGVGTAA